MKSCLDHGYTTGLKIEGYKLLFAQSHGGHCLLHRKVYAEAHGLPAQAIKGLVIRHTCDDPRCVEPSHLVIGAIADNNRDRVERGRSAKVYPSKRKLSDADAARIRAVYQPWHQEYSMRALAREYSVSLGSIHKIINGTSYFQEVTL